MMIKGQLNLKKSFRKAKLPSCRWQSSQRIWRKNAQVKLLSIAL